MESPWELVRALLMEINPDLTEEDLQFAPGNDKELIERLASKMQREGEYIKDWIESVAANKGKAS